MIIGRNRLVRLGSGARGEGGGMLGVMSEGSYVEAGKQHGKARERDGGRCDGKEQGSTHVSGKLAEGCGRRRWDRTSEHRSRDSFPGS